MTSSETRKPSWITTAEAARRAEVTPECIGQWVHRYGIGRKVGGRLRIEPEALDRLLAVSMHPRNGGRDFGTEESVSPIDVVMRHGSASTAQEAAFWRCEK